LKTDYAVESRKAVATVRVYPRMRYFGEYG